jgi:hypothetical protein
LKNKKTYLQDSFLSFLNFAKLNITKAQWFMLRTDRDFAAQYFSVLAKFGVQIEMVPLRFFEAFDEHGGALDVFTTWLTSDGMRVVWQRSADLVTLDERILVFLYGFLGIFYGLKHDKSVVELFEKWSKTNIELRIKIKNLTF